MYILSMVCFKLSKIDACFNSLSLKKGFIVNSWEKEGGRLALLCSDTG